MCFGINNILFKNVKSSFCCENVEYYSIKKLSMGSLVGHCQNLQSQNQLQIFTSLLVN